MNKKELIILIWVLLMITLLVYYFITKPKIGPLDSTHEHADFKVYINNRELNFARPEYMVKSKQVHVENMIGDEIHKHATGVTLRYFFKSLGFKFNKECFVLDDGGEYCNNEEESLKFYVNGQKNEEYGNYEIREGDKYLISYGSENEEKIKKQLDSV